MQRIQDLLERMTLKADRGYPPSDWQLAVAQLQILDVLVDELARIADSLEDIARNG